MNMEGTDNDRHYPVHAFPMDSGYTLDSHPNWDWMPPSPRLMLVGTDDEGHTERYIGEVANDLSDIVTDDLNRQADRKIMLTVEHKESITKVPLAKTAYIVLTNALRCNAWFNVSAVSEMFDWSKLSFDSPRTPLLIHDLTGLTGFQAQLLPTLSKKKKELQQVLRAYKARVEYLRSEAELDGIIVNEASERDFWSFFRSMSFLRKAGVILMDNGNLRAVWRGEDKSRIGLQFLGDQSIEYVIFKRRQGAKHISRAAGFDSLNGFKKLIQAFDLKTLVYT